MLFEVAAWMLRLLLSILSATGSSFSNDCLSYSFSSILQQLRVAASSLACAGRLYDGPEGERKNRSGMTCLTKYRALSVPEGTIPD